MKNKFLYLFSALASLIFINNTFAQFTGSTGSGYASSQSVIQQLNPPLYNDIELTGVIEPQDNEILNINNAYDLSFIIKNVGTYAVSTEDSIFFEVHYDNILLLDSFFFVTTKLHVGQSFTKTLTDYLIFSDSTDFLEFCISLKGTSFASDSVLDNNTQCNTLKVQNPSGIHDTEKSISNIRFNKDCNCLILNNFLEIENINLYDLSGKAMVFDVTKKGDNFILKLKEPYPKIILVNIHTSKQNITHKIFVY